MNPITNPMTFKHRISLASMLALFLLLAPGLSAQPEDHPAEDDEDTRAEPLPLNEPAPAFSGQNQHDEDISLASLREKGPVVIVFYRGHWCPNCRDHLSRMQDSLNMLKEAGAQVVAITPEQPQFIAKTMDKTGAEFDILHDDGHKIMDAYHVTYQLSGVKHLAHKVVGVNINKNAGNEDRVLPVPAIAKASSADASTARRLILKSVHLSGGCSSKCRPCNSPD